MFHTGRPGHACRESIKQHKYGHRIGCEKHAEAIISQIADSVAKAECRDTGRVKAEILETISLSIARSVAKAVLRRRPKLVANGMTPSAVLLEELECFEEPDG